MSPKSSCGNVTCSVTTDVVSDTETRAATTTTYFHDPPPRLNPEPTVQPPSFRKNLKHAQKDGEEQQTNEQRMMQLPWSDFRYDKQVVMFVPEANSIKLYKECTYSLF